MTAIMKTTATPTWSAWLLLKRWNRKVGWPIGLPARGATATITIARIKAMSRMSSSLAAKGDHTMSKEIYLGDGLYASFDGFMITLRAPRENGDHLVMLEPEVFAALVEFQKRVTTPISIIR